jgi:ubiquinone biosynthesis protein
MDLKSFRVDLKDMAEPFYGRSLKTISVKDVYDQDHAPGVQIPHPDAPQPAAALQDIYPDRGPGQDPGIGGQPAGGDPALRQTLLQQGYEAHKCSKIWAGT